MRPATAIPLCALLCLGGVLPPHHAQPVDDPKPVDFASLSDFKFVRGMKLPDHVTKLDKKKVRISGFMGRDGSGAGPVDYFMLINDACGCNGTPFLNEIVFCDMAQGTTTDIFPGIVTIEGTLYVGEVVEDGVVTSLYNLDVDRIVH